MKELRTIVKNELREDEKIFITTDTKLNDLNNKEWYVMDEYSFDELFNNISGKERVKRFWHEDGLCIILNR